MDKVQKNRSQYHNIHFHLWENLKTHNLIVCFSGSSCQIEPVGPYRLLSYGSKELCNIRTTLQPVRRVSVFRKLIVSQLVKKFPAVYGTRRFITLFASGLYPEPDESTPHPYFLFMCPIHVFPGLPAVPVSPSLPLPPTSQTHRHLLSCQHGNITVNFTIDNAKNVGP
jgi:hypothetical protein